MKALKARNNSLVIMVRSRKYVDITVEFSTMEHNFKRAKALEGHLFEHILYTLSGQFSFWCEYLTTSLVDFQQFLVMWQRLLKAPLFTGSHTHNVEFTGKGNRETDCALLSISFIPAQVFGERVFQRTFTNTNIAISNKENLREKERSFMVVHSI